MIFLRIKSFWDKKNPKKFVRKFWSMAGYLGEKVITEIALNMIFFANWFILSKKKRVQRIKKFGHFLPQKVQEIKISRNWKKHPEIFPLRKKFAKKKYNHLQPSGKPGKQHKVLKMQFSRGKFRPKNNAGFSLRRLFMGVAPPCTSMGLGGGTTHGGGAPPMVGGRTNFCQKTHKNRKLSSAGGRGHCHF